MPLLVDVWGTHCAPCKALEALLLRQQDDLLQRWELYKLCASDYREWCVSNQIRQVPTVLVYFNGIIVKRETQLLTDGQLQRFIASIDQAEEGVDNVDDLIRKGDYLGVRTQLGGLSGEELRAPQFQRASSTLAMRGIELDVSLEQVRDTFIAMALNDNWDAAVNGLYSNALIDADNYELHALSFALLDLLPDRQVAQRWRRKFHQLDQSISI